MMQNGPATVLASQGERALAQQQGSEQRQPKDANDECPMVSDDC